MSVSPLSEQKGIYDYPHQLLSVDTIHCFTRYANWCRITPSYREAGIPFYYCTIKPDILVSKIWLKVITTQLLYICADYVLSVLVNSNYEAVIQSLLQFLWFFSDALTTQVIQFVWNPEKEHQRVTVHVYCSSPLGVWWFWWTSPYSYTGKTTKRRKQCHFISHSTYSPLSYD